MPSLPRLTGGTTKVLVVLLLVTQLAILVSTARNSSETYDEPMYLLASRSYWNEFDFSFNREHPPLTKLLIGAPLAAKGLRMPAEYHTDGATQMRFVYELNDDPEATLFAGRFAMILLGLVMLFYAFLFGRKMGGDEVGLLSMLAAMSFPGLTGNTPLAALDLGAAAFAFIALYHLAMMREKSTPLRVLLAGVTFGLAQLTKFSNLLLVPVYGLLILIDVVRERSVRPLGRLVAIFLVGFTTMFFGYGCEMRTVASVSGHPRYSSSTPGEFFDFPPLRIITKVFGDKPIPMLTYFKGFDITKTKGEKGHASYYRGETRWPFALQPGEEMKGWKSFYLTVMGVKTPIGLLVAMLLSLSLVAFMPTRKGWDGALILFPLLMFAYFSWAPSQLGLRYILPVLPGVAVLVGRLLSFDPSRNRRVTAAALLFSAIVVPLGMAWDFRVERGSLVDLKLAIALVVPALIALVLVRFSLGSVPDRALRKSWKLGVSLLVLLGFLESLASHPEHLMFFNPIAGGGDNGWKIVSVGDDWGQGASQLAKYQREHGIDEIRYDYYGTGIPDIYGLVYRPFNGQPVSGIVAVHALQLTRERFKGIGNYEWLDGLEPIDRVSSILIFDVPQAYVDSLAKH